jgi:hypothetical protein
VRNKADEVLRQHGASGSAEEVDALHSILNNINVQTKNIGGTYRSNMRTSNDTGRLPPI